MSVRRFIEVAVAYGAACAAVCVVAVGDAASQAPDEPVASPPPLLDSSSLWILGGGAVIAALAHEQPIFRDSGRMASVVERVQLDGVIDFADAYGAGQSLGLTSLGLLGLGEVVGSEALAQTGEELAAALIGAWATTWALKLSVGARRPNGGPHSFPSGHTATAFAAAPVIERNFGAAAGGAAYALATMTALSRMEERRHWFADVAAGAAIGIVAGRSLRSWSSLTWIVSGSGLGVAVRF